jgi:hypothetical protein
MISCDREEQETTIKVEECIIGLHLAEIRR